MLGITPVPGRCRQSLREGEEEGRDDGTERDDRDGGWVGRGGLQIDRQRGEVRAEEPWSG